MKREHIIVGIIFLIVFGIKLYFSFQTPYFSSDETYYNIRQLVHIKETFFPIFQDDLSYGGKTLYLPPLFFYLLAVLSYIFKTEFVGKFFPALFSSSIVIISYLIAERLTKNKVAQLFTAVMAGFMPIFFSYTLNTISIYSLVAPLIFICIYFMMRVVDKEKRFIPYFIISLLILRMTTPAVIFLIFGLLAYLVFLFLEKMEMSKIEIELILFSTFLIIWTLFLFFKNAFLNYGFAILWQNIPRDLLKNYFANTNLLTIMYLIGIIPFIFGLYSVYKYTFREKDKDTYLLISFGLVIALLMWLRLIELNISLIFIGLVATFLFAKAYDDIISFIKNTRLRLTFTAVLFILIIISSVIPSLALASNKIRQTYSEQEIDALLWFRSNADKDSLILSTLSEGNLIATIALRKNFIDSNFMFVSNIDQRLEDAYKMYKTTSETEAIGLINKYNISYIYFSKRAKEEYNIEKIPYIEDKCFEKKFFNDDVEIYKSLCSIEER